MEFAWSDGGGTQVDRGRRSFWVLGNSIFIHFPIRILCIRRVLDNRKEGGFSPGSIFMLVGNSKSICARCPRRRQRHLQVLFFFVKVAQV